MDEYTCVVFATDLCTLRAKRYGKNEGKERKKTQQGLPLEEQSRYRWVPLKPDFLGA